MVPVGGDAPHIEPTYGSFYLKTRSRLICALYFLCSSTTLHRWSISPSWLSPQASTALLKENVNLGYYVHQALVYKRPHVYQNGSSGCKVLYAIKALGWYDRLNYDGQLLWKISFCACLFTSKEVSDNQKCIAIKCWLSRDIYLRRSMKIFSVYFFFCLSVI